MRRFAQNTAVSSERSRAEIESLLRKYGASGFGYMWKGASAVIVFEMRDRRIRFTLPLPDESDQRYRKTPTGRIKRNQSSVSAAWEQDCRSRWRSLTLCIKAKLESVASEIESFEEAFLPHIVLPDGSTVGDFIVPQIAVSYGARRMPPMLPAAGGRK